MEPCGQQFSDEPVTGLLLSPKRIRKCQILRLLSI